MEGLAHHGNAYDALGRCIRHIISLYRGQNGRIYRPTSILDTRATASLTKRRFIPSNTIQRLQQVLSTCHTTVGQFFYLARRGNNTRMPVGITTLEARWIFIDGQAFGNSPSTDFMRQELGSRNCGTHDMGGG